MPKLDSGAMCTHRTESRTSPGPWPSETRMPPQHPDIGGAGSGQWLCTAPAPRTVGSSHPVLAPSMPGPLDGWVPESSVFTPGWAVGPVGVCRPPWAPRALTLSWDLETLPLFSTSSAVKAYQMDFSSSFRRAMAEAPAHGGSDTEIRFQEMQTVAETTEGLARGESSTCLLAGCLC